MIGVYKELLEAMAKFRHSFSEDEIQTIKESLRKLQHLLKHTPQCDSSVLELALGSIRLVNYRLGQNPGFDLPYAFRPTSSGSIEEVLFFVETKEKVLISAINDVLQDGPLPEFVYNDTRSLLICTGKYDDNYYCTSKNILQHTVKKLEVDLTQKRSSQL